MSTQQQVSERLTAAQRRLAEREARMVARGGNLTHADRRTRRNRTRSAQNRNAMRDWR